MIKKTFNIGEYAKGGVISVEIKGKAVTIIGREWDFSKGSNKNSDQTNSPEFTRETFNADNETVRRELEEFLNDLTTSYYTDQIIEYIESNVKLYMNLRW